MSANIATSATRPASLALALGFAAAILVGCGTVEVIGDLSAEACDAARAELRVAVFNWTVSADALAAGTSALDEVDREWADGSYGQCVEKAGEAYADMVTAAAAAMM